MKPNRLLPAAVALAWVALSHAAVPLMTSYQGRVRVNGADFTGTGHFKFVLLASPGGASLWSNDGTSVNGSEPAAAVALPVKEGLFTVLLGDATLPNMRPLRAEIFTANPQVSLRVWFDDGVNGSVQLRPDTALGAVPYAMAATVAEGSITGTHLAPGTIGPDKLVSANAPAAGRVLTYDGAQFNWADPGIAGRVWSVLDGSAYYNGGSVGIGTDRPQHRLSLQGGPTWTDNGWVGALSLENGAAIGWEANVAGQRFGMGHTGAGFFMFRTGSDPGTKGERAHYDFAINDAGNVGIGTWIPDAKLHVEGPGTAIHARATDATSGVFAESTSPQPGTAAVYGRNLAGFAMAAEGSVTQNRDKGGWVKAMLYVRDKEIVRCFNSFLPGDAGSTPKCGFDIVSWWNSTGLTPNWERYVIAFPFPIADRFISITPVSGEGQLVGTTFSFEGNDRLVVYVYSADEHAYPEGGFMIVVF